MRRLALLLALAGCADPTDPEPIDGPPAAECVCEPTEDIEALQACARDSVDIDLDFPVCLQVECLVGGETLLVSVCVAPE